MKRARPPRNYFERAIWYLSKFQGKDLVEILLSSVDPQDLRLIVSDVNGYLASLNGRR
jgi:hypothetical protein